MAEKVKEFFVYMNGDEHRPITASANNVTSTIRINNDAPFVLCMTEQRVNTTTTGTVQFVATGNFNAPPLLVLWSDAAGTFWIANDKSQYGMSLDSLYGDGRLPHYLKYALTLPAGAFFNVTLTNLLASSLYAYLAHEGFKQFKPDPQPGA